VGIGTAFTDLAFLMCTIESARKSNPTAPGKLIAGLSRSSGKTRLMLGD